MVVGDVGVGKSTLVRFLAAHADIERLVYVDPDDREPGESLADCILRAASARPARPVAPDGRWAGAMTSLIVVEDVDSILLAERDLDRSRDELAARRGAASHTAPPGRATARDWPNLVGDLVALVAKRLTRRHNPVVFTSADRARTPLARLEVVCHSVRMFAWQRRELGALYEAAIAQALGRSLADVRRFSSAAVTRAFEAAADETHGDLRSLLFHAQAVAHGVRIGRAAQTAPKLAVAPAGAASSDQSPRRPHAPAPAAAAAATATARPALSANNSAIALGPGATTDGAAAAAALDPMAAEATDGRAAPAVPRMAELAGSNDAFDLADVSADRAIGYNKWRTAHDLLLPPVCIQATWHKAIASAIARRERIGSTASQWFDAVGRASRPRNPAARLTTTLALAAADPGMAVAMVHWNAPLQLDSWLERPLDALGAWCEQLSAADVIETNTWPLSTDDPMASPALAIAAGAFSLMRDVWLAGDNNTAGGHFQPAAIAFPRPLPAEPQKIGARARRERRTFAQLYCPHIPTDDLPMAAPFIARHSCDKGVVESFTPLERRRGIYGGAIAKPLEEDECAACVMGTDGIERLASWALPSVSPAGTSAQSSDRTTPATRSRQPRRQHHRRHHAPDTVVPAGLGQPATGQKQPATLPAQNDAGVSSGQGARDPPLARSAAPLAKRPRAAAYPHDPTPHKANRSPKRSRSSVGDGARAGPDLQRGALMPPPWPRLLAAATAADIALHGADPTVVAT
jgi:hypothetical protein